VLFRSNIIQVTSGSAVSVTLVALGLDVWPIGGCGWVQRMGAGEVQFVAGSGQTLRAAGGRDRLNGQYAEGYVKRIGLSEWLVGGDLKV
jgi:hypothetical protein